MNTVITTILTSTVVSTIFLALSNIFIEQRKRSVEYITNERANGEMILGKYLVK